MSYTFYTAVELSMALDRLVPAMALGMTIITTTGGQLNIPPSRLAARLADELSHALRLELMRRGVQVPEGESS